MTVKEFDPKDPIIECIQKRKINRSAVKEYSDLMKDGVEFEACKAVEDGKVYIWDGQIQSAIKCSLLMHYKYSLCMSYTHSSEYNYKNH